MQDGAWSRSALAVNVAPRGMKDCVWLVADRPRWDNTGVANSFRESESAPGARKKKGKARPVEAEPAHGASSTLQAPSAARGRFRGETIWALVTGLAVGFAVGREVGGCQRGNDAPGVPTTGDVAPAASSSRRAYKSVSEFPPGWTKDTDIKGDYFAGLNDEQKAMALQVLNERTCDCGCPFGTLANCLAKDPGCPRSPALARLAVAAVKAGKDLDAVGATVDARQVELGRGNAPGAAAEPTGPVYVAVARHNARKGPWPAKVTVLEFSDFQ